MKYYLIAGEKSGDTHAGGLMRELRLIDPQAQFRCWGGDAMQAEAQQTGGELVVHHRHLSFIGVWEVIRNLGTLRRYMKQCEQDLLAWKPDVLILVDYPGFNLRMAAFAHRHGIRTFYYISPKIWAWNQRRAYTIRKVVDRMFTILPFETEFYRQYDYPVDFVGNPVADSLAAFQPNPDFLAQLPPDPRPIVALLPGSRKSEVGMMLPLMAEVAPDFPDYRFVVAGVDTLPAELYEPAYKAGLPVVFNQTYDLLSFAQASIVTSGTASLETALLNVPQVVCYKSSWLTYKLVINFVKVNFLSLVNLIMEREVVKELYQYDCNRERFGQELARILGPERERILQDYATLKGKIWQPGVAARTARLMYGYMG